MKLTQFTDYTVRVLMYLAARESGPQSGPESGQQRRPITIQEIAAAYAISRNNLMKVVNELARNGLVVSSRGKHGGIRLATAPDRISIGRVVRQAEGASELVECFNANNGCRITGACRLAGVLNEALDAFYSRLDGVTLADLVGHGDRLRRLLRAA